MKAAGAGTTTWLRVLDLNEQALAYLGRDAGRLAANNRQALAALSHGFGAVRAASDLSDAEAGFLRATLHANRSIALVNRPTGDPRRNRIAALRAARSAALEFEAVGRVHEGMLAIAAMGAIFVDCAQTFGGMNSEAAISSLTTAIAALSEIDPQSEGLAIARINLGIAYLHRQLGDAADNIERSIEELRGGLESPHFAPGSRTWQAAMVNLAEAYLNRTREGSAANLDQSVSTARAAQSAAAIRSDLADAELALGNALMLRAHVNNSFPTDTEEAIGHFRVAERLFRSLGDRKRRARAAAGLGTAYSDRSEGRPRENCRRALEYLRSATRVLTSTGYPIDWGIIQNYRGLAYDRLARLGEPRAASLARRCYQRGFRALLARPLEAARVQRNLAESLFRAELFEEALRASLRAIAIAELVLAESDSVRGRLQAASVASVLHSLAAFCAIRTGRPQQGLLLLEHGRARLAIEALYARATDVDSLPPEAQRDRRRARAAVDALLFERESGRGLRRTAEEAALEAALGKAVEEAANLRGLAGPDATGAASPGVPVHPGEVLIVPIITSKGAVVLIVDQSGEVLDVIELAQLDIGALQREVFASQPEGLLTAYRAARANPDAQVRWEQRLDTALRWIGDSIVGPIHQRLETLGLGDAPVLLLPQGILAALPLHAGIVGGTETTCGPMPERQASFLDWHCVTYTPSLSLRSMAHRNDLNTATDRLLLVSDTGSALPFARMETERVGRHFPSRAVLGGELATKAAVTTELQGAGYAHFAVHGTYNWLDVLASSIQLSNSEVLSVADLFSIRALETTRLAVLSACETGMTDLESAPEEYLGLSAGFIGAGVDGVVSTLWAVDDMATAIVVDQLYRHLASGLKPAEALRRSQLWTRDLSIGELRASDWWSEIQSLAEHDPIVHAWSRAYDDDDLARPFALPFQWASFIYSGV